MLNIILANWFMHIIKSYFCKLEINSDLVYTVFITNIRFLGEEDDDLEDDDEEDDDEEDDLYFDLTLANNAHMTNK